MWHTSKSAGLVISITEPVEAAALLGGGGAEDMARRCSSGCSGCRVRLHRSMAAGVRALLRSKVGILILPAWRVEYPGRTFAAWAAGDG